VLARGQRGRGRCSGAGGTGSPLGEVQLGVRDEHPRGEGHSPGNTRERVAHHDGGGALKRRRRPGAATIRGGGGALRNGVRLRRAIRLEEE
jgi:hypothetical protein